MTTGNGAASSPAVRSGRGHCFPVHSLATDNEAAKKVKVALGAVRYGSGWNVSSTKEGSEGGRRQQQQKKSGTARKAMQWISGGRSRTRRRRRAEAQSRQARYLLPPQWATKAPLSLSLSSPSASPFRSLPLSQESDIPSTVHLLLLRLQGRPLPRNASFPCAARGDVECTRNE